MCVYIYIYIYIYVCMTVCKDSGRCRRTAAGHPHYKLIMILFCLICVSILLNKAK